MVSRCNLEAEHGTLVFDIAGYSLLKGLGDGKFICSASFAVGGHDWSIRFYPNGDSAEDSKGYVSVYLELTSKTNGTGVMARFDMRLLNQATGVSKVLMTQLTPKLFEVKYSVWGIAKFKKISELEASQYLQDDRIVIECDVTVVLGTPVSTSETVCEIQVPRSDLADDLRKLLEAEERTDITFKVEEKVFHAHKFVLAMRSPVFKAELYEPMSHKGRRGITIEDMQPAVFKALLHFIYTDSLPAMDDLDEDENEGMVKHLLVAAD
ncbi:BTB/POZ and MATH domain-containing protein 1, partial [Dichanthelium oligosanthes]